MESWQQPCSPDDLVELAYLGLSLVFGGSASPAQLLDCARDAMGRASFYQSQWLAGEPFDDVQLSKGRAARLQSIVKENRGALICTFQIGPFLQLPFYLSKMGLPVMLLMDPENFEYRMNSCTGLGIGQGSVPYGCWPKSDPASRPVNFITSDDQSALWKMAQWLKSGNVLFAYLDGNRGLKEEYNEKNSVAVPFFGADVWVRKGLAYLAGFTGAPLMFMVCRKEKAGHVVRLSPPFRKRENESMEAFCQRCIGRAFQLLKAHIREDVACWNEWHQLHRWVRRVKAASSTPAEPLSADQALERSLRLEPQLVQVRFGEQDVLVNQKTGAALLFTPAIADILRLAESGSTVAEILNRLNGNYEEETLLEVIHTLAKEAFLRVNGS